MDELRMKSCSRILLLVATAAVAVSCQCAQKSAAQTEWIERPDAFQERYTLEQIPMRESGKWQSLVLSF